MFRAAEHQFHRHLQAVIDVDLTADQRIEMAFDQLVDEMPGEIDGAFEVRNIPAAPTFVDRPVGFRDADGEGRHPVKEEAVAMIVEDHHGHIGLSFPHPVLGDVIAVEERFPVGRFGQTAVECHADRRHVGRADTTNDFSHGSPSFQGARSGTARGACRPVQRRSG